MAVASHVVGESWLREAAKGAASVSSARDHAATFPELERKWRFSLRESLASRVKVFHKCAVVIVLARTVI